MRVTHLYWNGLGKIRLSAAYGRERAKRCERRQRTQRRLVFAIRDPFGQSLIRDSSGLERRCAGGRWRADVRRVRMRRSRFALYVRVGRDNDEWIARVVQRGNAVVEEAQCAMRAVLMMGAVLCRRVIVRSARVVVMRSVASRMLLGMLRRHRSIRQRQQPMPQDRQDGDPYVTAAMSKQTEHW